MKKVKKIEFSDDKLKDPIKEVKNIMQMSDVDKVALNIPKGKAPMLYQDYSKMKKAVLIDKPYLEITEDSMASFILPSETTNLLMIETINDPIAENMQNQAKNKQ